MTLGVAAGCVQVDAERIRIVAGGVASLTPTSSRWPLSRGRHPRILWAPNGAYEGRTDEATEGDATMAKKPAEPKAPQGDDVEGHGYMLDPIMARQLSRDRSAEMERASRERARQKEARPNKQHQD